MSAPPERIDRTDVQLAAFAFEYDADMFSNDTDFARFPGLRWRNPLT